MTEHAFYRWHEHNLLLFCHLQPGASQDEFAGRYGDRLKIRIAAPPLEGKANKQLIAFLAKQFGVAKSAITISSGASGRQKNLLISQPSTLPAGLGIEKNYS
jgi:uncharacterized protein (TIGR00251 family)